MKKIYLFIFLFIGLSVQISAQADNPLMKLRNLIGGTWKIEGQWKNGDKFEQRITNEWGVGQKIIKSQTFGIINPETNITGLRSEGIRAFNAQNGQIEFWEFDIFGGITTGKILIDENKIIFEYVYNTPNGKFQMRDVWEKDSNDKYRYSILQNRNDEWNIIMLTGTATREQEF